LKRKYEVFTRGAEIKAVAVNNDTRLLRKGLLFNGYTLTGEFRLDPHLYTYGEVEVIEMKKKTAKTETQTVK